MVQETDKWKYRVDTYYTPRVDNLFHEPKISYNIDGA